MSISLSSPCTPQNCGRNRFDWKLWFTCVLTSSALLIHQEASATCRFLSGGKQTVYVDGGTYTTGRDTSKVLTASTKVYATGPMKVSCDKADDAYRVVNYLSSDAFDYIFMPIDGGIYDWVWNAAEPGVAGLEPFFGSHSKLGIGTWDMTGLKNQIVVLKPLESHDGLVIKAGLVATLKMDELEVLDLYLNSDIVVDVLSCRTPDISVNMGKGYASELAGKDTFSSHSEDVIIRFEGCPIGYYGAHVYIRPTAPAYAIDDAVLNLDPSSTAQGVGIQLVKSDGVSLLDLTRNISLGVGSGGYFEIPLKARYYQTAESVRGGTVSASAVLDISYR